MDHQTIFCYSDENHLNRMLKQRSITILGELEFNKPKTKDWTSMLKNCVYVDMHSPIHAQLSLRCSESKFTLSFVGNFTQLASSDMVEFYFVPGGKVLDVPMIVSKITNFATPERAPLMAEKQVEGLFLNAQTLKYIEKATSCFLVMETRNGTFLGFNIIFKIQSQDNSTVIIFPFTRSGNEDATDASALCRDLRQTKKTLDEIQNFTLTPQEMEMLTKTVSASTHSVIGPETYIFGLNYKQRIMNLTNSMEFTAAAIFNSKWKLCESAEPRCVAIKKSLWQLLKKDKTTGTVTFAYQSDLPDIMYVFGDRWNFRIATDNLSVDSLFHVC